MGRLILSGLFFCLIIIGVGFYLRETFHTPVHYDDFWLDSPLTHDKALSHPEYLVSNRLPSPTNEQKKQPVCLLVHGFSASTFEFDAFKSTVLAKDPEVLFSTILMGGHGRNYDSFKAATYDDWFVPISAEIDALTNLGFQNIILFGVSTGATGILHLLLNGAYENKPVTHIFLLDPYIIPKNSNLYLVPYLKFFISNVRSSASRPIEYANWHVNRPSAALHELLKLTQTIQQQLQMPLTGLKTYPQLTVFTAENDPTSATEGADLIASAFGDDKLSLVRFNSDRHVIIEPQAKLNWSLQDQQHFDSVVNTVFLAIQP